jgi:hypothetical protein
VLLENEKRPFAGGSGWNVVIFLVPFIRHAPIGWIGYIIGNGMRYDMLLADSYMLRSGTFERSYREMVETAVIHGMN